MSALWHLIHRICHGIPHRSVISAFISPVPRGPLSRGGDVAVYHKFLSFINLPSLPTQFYSVLVSVSVFLVLSTAFHSINSPDNFPLSHSVLPVFFLPYWSFQLYIYLFMNVSLNSDLIISG